MNLMKLKPQNNMFFKLGIGIKHIAKYTASGLNILGVTCFVVVIKNNYNYNYWYHQHVNQRTG